MWRKGRKKSRILRGVAEATDLSLVPVGDVKRKKAALQKEAPATPSLFSKLDLDFFKLQTKL